MTEIICPLCSGNTHIIQETIETINLRKWYNDLGAKTSHLLTNNILRVEKLHCSMCGIVHYSPLIEGDGLFYTSLQDKNNYYPQNKREYDIVMDFIIKYKVRSLVEIGCGNGYFLDKLQYFIPKNKLTGTEINNDAIVTCEKKGLKIENNLTSIQSNSIDMVISFQVMEHVGDIHKILQESIRILKPGGYLIIAVPNQNGYIGKIHSILNLPPHHVLGWTKDAFDFINSTDVFDINLIDYKKEPINPFMYIDYLSGLVAKNFQSKGIIVKLILKLQRLCMFFFSPWIFGTKTVEIDGHTHIAFYQKK